MAFKVHVPDGEESYLDDSSYEVDDGVLVVRNGNSTITYGPTGWLRVVEEYPPDRDDVRY